jgi:predicted transcriptional regulator
MPRRTAVLLVLLALLGRRGGRRRREPVVVQLSREPGVMVSCRLCGRKAYNLGRHLGSRHNLTSEQYARFPAAPVTSALYRTHVAGARKPHRKRDPRYGTSSSLSAFEGRIPCRICGRLYHSLGPHLRTHGLSASEYLELHGGPLVSPACRDIHRELTRDLNDGIAWDQQAIITAIRRWAGKHGGQPPKFNAWAGSRMLRARRFSSAGVDYPTATRLQQVFGSWSAGLAAAGFEPRARGRAFGATRKRCAKGHPLTPDNVHTSKTGIRRCLKCHRNYQREWARRARAEGRRQQND